MVEFGVTDDALLAADQLERLPGVVGLRQQDGRWMLQVAELHTVMPVLLSLLDGRGAPLTELRTYAPTLEDVFVSLTGRHLRDG